MKNYKLELDDPIYITPKYIRSKGEATDIAFSDKRIQTEYRTIKTVTKNIFLKACVDMDAMRAKASEITGRKNLVPLFVNSRVLLVPLKMRKPAVRGDACYGYVNYFALDDIGGDDSHRNIIFLNGLSVSVLCSADSIRRSCGYASMVSRAECFRASCEKYKSSHKYFYGNGENPATKSDVEELMKEMWKIREVLGR